MGNKGRGIRNVRVNEKFTDLDSGAVGRHYGQWKHYHNNPTFEDDPPERAVRAKQIMDEADEYIFKRTGFHPEQVHNIEIQLNKEYRGKQTAPCIVELFDEV